jgi:hypothetical protein
MSQIDWIVVFLITVGGLLFLWLLWLIGKK